MEGLEHLHPVVRLAREGVAQEIQALHLLERPRQPIDLRKVAEQVVGEVQELQVDQLLQARQAPHRVAREVQRREGPAQPADALDGGNRVEAHVQRVKLGGVLQVADLRDPVPGKAQNLQRGQQQQRPVHRADRVPVEGRDLQRRPRAPLGLALAPLRRQDVLQRHDRVLDHQLLQLGPDGGDARHGGRREVRVVDLQGPQGREGPEVQGRGVPPAARGRLQPDGRDLQQEVAQLLQPLVVPDVGDVHPQVVQGLCAPLPHLLGPLQQLEPRGDVLQPPGVQHQRAVRLQQGPALFLHERQELQQVRLPAPAVAPAVPPVRRHRRRPGPGSPAASLAPVPVGQGRVAGLQSQ